MIEPQHIDPSAHRASSLPLVVERYEATPAHVRALRELCQHWQASDNFWSFDDILRTIAVKGVFVLFVADPDDTDHFAATLIARQTLDVCEIVYLYVRPDRRRQGYGESLMDALLASLAHDVGSNFLSLEVREENRGAQRLYAQFGLQRVGIRKRYYADGSDALLMAREVESCL